MKTGSPEHKAFLARQAACTCLTPERRGYIQAALDFADSFSDGAFMEEKGIDVSELEAFSIEHDCLREVGPTPHQTI